LVAHPGRRVSPLFLRAKQAATWFNEGTVRTLEREQGEQRAPKIFNRARAFTVGGSNPEARALLDKRFPYAGVTGVVEVKAMCHRTEFS